MGADLEPEVGGVLELHYSHPLLGPVYPIRLAVTLFNPTPAGPQNDYLYSGGGGYTPGEAGVLDTFLNLAACWAPYYDPGWSLILARVYQNVDGLAVPLVPTPTIDPVAGTAAPMSAEVSVCKRTLWLMTANGERWRVWLRQLPVAGIGETIPVSSTGGGVDARDRAWYVYVSSSLSGVVGRDGARVQATGKVRAWWDSPPAPYVVSG